MGLNFPQVELLLLIAAVVTMVAQRLRLPYTFGLVVAGSALAAFSLVPPADLTKELIFNAFLPPLIFEAAFYLEWKELRRNFPVITLLATVGVVFSAAFTALGMRWLGGWTWSASLLFGTLIAATDPVSVIATFKEAGLQGRLRLLVEAESLFNDATAAVVLTIVMTTLGAGHVTLLGGTLMFIKVSAGGVLCGAVVGWAMLGLVGRTTNHMVEITFTTAAAYGSFWLAERFHLSGVLASLTAGLLIGNIGPCGILTEKGREAVETFWEYAAFVVNSLIFLLIGVRLPHQNFGAVLLPALLAIALVAIGRALAVYPLCWVFARSELKVTARDQHILWWGGLRGALALALSLGLPPQTPQRAEIITVAFAVVAFSVTAQGLTMTPLLRRLGAIEKTPAKP